SDVYASWQSDIEEKDLVQGVIDCVIPKDVGWILLDYKTDTIAGGVNEATGGNVRKRCEVLLRLYKQAIEQIWQEPVKEAYLYFVSKQLVLKVRRIQVNIFCFQLKQSP